MTRGEEGFYAFMDALRSRQGAWQGYLADMIEMQFNPAIVRGLTNTSIFNNLQGYQYNLGVFS